jgi:hypothetical protein
MERDTGTYRETQRHHRQPSVKPSNPGRGVIRSLPTPRTTFSDRLMNHLCVYAFHSAAVWGGLTLCLGKLEPFFGHDSRERVRCRVLR